MDEQIQTQKQEILLENNTPLQEAEPGEPVVQRGLYQRWFGRMNEGSLRLVVISITLCGTTGSFFWYPYFLKLYGVWAGLAIMMLCLFLSYINCVFIFRASMKHNENDYLTLIHHVLGERAFWVGKLTYFFDYFVTYVAGLLIGWNIIQYLLYYWGVFDDSMRSSKTELEFHPYHPKVLMWRSIFVWGASIAMIPLFRRQNMDGLKFVFLSYTISFLCVVTYLMFDLNEFKIRYQATGEHILTFVKPFDVRTFQFVLIFLSSFYVQPNLLTMKRDLANPNERRLLKTINISHFIFLVFGVVFGTYGYYCLGDIYTSPLFMLRQSFEGKRHEWAYRGLLLWTVCNAMIYLSFFNLSFKNYINSLTKKKLNQVFVIYAPFFSAALLAWGYPKIEKILGVNAIFVCLINGFIFPTLLKRQIDIEDGCGIWKRTFWTFQVFLYLSVAGVSFYQILFGETL